MVGIASGAVDGLEPFMAPNRHRKREPSDMAGRILLYSSLFTTLLLLPFCPTSTAQRRGAAPSKVFAVSCVAETVKLAIHTFEAAEAAPPFELHVWCRA